MQGKRDPLLKSLLRGAYRRALGLQVSLRARARAGEPRLFYGGARAGSGGGPLVKVARLQAAFPEDRRHYNLVYLLSNAPYLPASALATLKARGVPMVLNQNGTFYPAWFDGDWQARNALMAQAYHAADHVFWQSAFCRRFADEHLGRRQGPGEILFNAIDTAHFTPAQRPERPVTFLVAGKIEHHLYPRVGDAVMALAGLRKQGIAARLIVAGSLDDESARRAEADIARFGLDTEVDLTGPYTQAVAPAIYRRADIYLMTKPNDPCPNTVLEAMACGLPVVYSATGGVPELAGETGWPLAVEESTQTMIWPLAGPLTETMAAAARGYAERGAAARARAVERFDIAPWIARHRAVFEDLLSRGSKS